MKLANEYQAQLKIFNEVPKAVFAAIAISLLTCGGDEEPMQEIDKKIAWEWRALYQSGIVPQQPRGKTAKILAMMPEDYEPFE